jgi:hypothetical protein
MCLTHTHGHGFGFGTGFMGMGQILHDLTFFGVFWGLFDFWQMEYMSDHLGIKRGIVGNAQKSIQRIFT